MRDWLKMGPSTKQRAQSLLIRNSFPERSRDLWLVLCLNLALNICHTSSSNVVSNPSCICDYFKKDTTSLTIMHIKLSPCFISPQTKTAPTLVTTDIIAAIMFQKTSPVLMNAWESPAYYYSTVHLIWVVLKAWAFIRSTTHFNEIRLPGFKCIAINQRVKFHLNKKAMGEWEKHVYFTGNYILLSLQHSPFLKLKWHRGYYLRVFQM